MPAASHHTTRNPPLPPSSAQRETIADKASAWVAEQWPDRTFALWENLALYVLHLQQTEPALDDDARALGREFAYLHATSVIETHCVIAESTGLYVYHDTRSADVDLTDEVKYLHARRLLDVHPQHPHWVSLRDKDEPLPEANDAHQG